MEYDLDKIDEAALALLAQTMFEDHGIKRAWKGMDWDVMNRLAVKAWIADPKGKSNCHERTGVNARAQQRSPLG